MHDKLTEMMAKIEEIKRTKETLLSWVQQEVNVGKDCFHVESVGATVDMIKDLAETEKGCAEALYYMVVVNAMLNGEDPSYEEAPMGYNHRHLKNGEFARSGRGHMVGGTSGFHHGPFVDEKPYIDAYLHDPNFKPNMLHRTMGYNGDWDENSKSKYGKAYDDYLEARRHYTASGDQLAKEKMDHHTMEHVNNALESMQEMWESSDDAMLKKRIVDEASKVLNQMKTAMGMPK